MTEKYKCTCSACEGAEMDREERLSRFLLRLLFKIILYPTVFLIGAKIGSLTVNLIIGE